MTTRVGYVGVDHHHRDPYFALASKLSVEIVALCEPGEDYTTEDVLPEADRPDEIDLDPSVVEDVAERATIYADPAEMFAAEDIDVAWISYRNDAVPDIIDAAVDHGIDVLSEKPAARSAADFEPVAVRAKDADVTIGLTYFYRYNPVARDLRRRVRDEEFGPLWAVDGRYVGSKLELRDTSRYIYDDDISRGGVLQWIGLHWIDLIMYVLDERIKRVSARETTATDLGVDEGLTMQFETASGTLGTFQTGYYLGEPIKDSHLGLYGPDGSARSPVHHVRKEGSTVSLDLKSDTADWAGAPNREVEFTPSYDRFPIWSDFVLDYFAAYFDGREDGDVPADVDDGLRVLRVLDAAYEAVESDGWVSVAGGDQC